jgi:uncharacterized protein involved in type VI secretion and phage assembly
MSETELLSGLLPLSEQSGHFYGVTIGVVTNNKDPDKLGRVKVKFPWLSDQVESHWARVVTLMAGKERGLYFLPEVDDEVLVAFEHGMMEFPYVLGALWNGQDKPPLVNNDGKNNLRTIKSRSGHVITLDDTQGEEKIIIRDKTAKNEIVIDSKNNTLSMKVEKDLMIETKGKISLKSSGGDLEIECNNLKVQAKQNCEIKANASITVQANAQLALKGPAGVKVNDGALEVM